MHSDIESPILTSFPPIHNTLAEFENMACPEGLQQMLQFSILQIKINGNGEVKSMSSTLQGEVPPPHLLPTEQ